MNSTSMEMEFSVPEDEQPRTSVAPRAGRRAVAGRRAAQQESSDNWDQDAGGSGGASAFSPTPPSGPRPDSASTGGAPPGPTSAFGMDADSMDGSLRASMAGSIGGGGGAQPPPRSRDGRAPSAGPPPPQNNAFDFNFDESAAQDKKFTGISRRKQEQAERNQTEERTRAQRKYDEKEQREEVLDIPEMEDEGNEDITTLVADAPKVRSNRVQDIAELEGDMQFRLPSNDDRDIDLSLLTACLCSSEQVHEGDELWDYEQLFTAVASELNLEKEKTEERTNPEAAGVPGDGGTEPKDLGGASGSVMM